MPVEHIQVDVQPPSGSLRRDLPGGLAAALCRIVVEVSGGTKPYPVRDRGDADFAAVGQR